MKAAVLGAGPHGRRIVDVIVGLEGVELAAVVDTREAALASLQLPGTTARYTSAEQLWKEEAAKIVCIATNGPSHARLAIDAMNSGATHVIGREADGNTCWRTATI